MKKRHIVAVAAGLTVVLGGCATRYTPEQEAMLKKAQEITQEQREFDYALNKAVASFNERLSYIENIERGSNTQKNGGKENGVEKSGADGSTLNTSKESEKVDLSTNDEERIVEKSVTKERKVIYNDGLETVLEIVNFKNAPVEDFLRKVADQSGVAFKMTGKAKPLGLININERNIKARVLLEKVSENLEDKVDLVFNKTTNTLEVRFK